MRRHYKIGIGIIILLLIAGYFYYTFPQKFNRTYDGIKYKIGDTKQQQQITVTLNGFYYKRLFYKDYFKGSICIDNEKYPSTEQYPQIKLLVNEELQRISYYDWERNMEITYGEAFIGDDLAALTICVYNGPNAWNSKDGLMVSAPAKSRAEAVEISNRLISNALKRNLNLK